MHISPALLDEATARGILQRDQSLALWRFFVEHQQAHAHQTPGFKPAHVLYYLGGMIAIGAMTLFMNLGWERFAGAGLLAISAAYGAMAVALTEFFLRRKQLALPAGICAVLAVSMVAMAVYAAQHALGLWPADDATHSAYRDYHTHIDWRWLLMELATLGAAAIALWRYRLPFLVLPVAVTLWYLSMDLTPFLLGGSSANFFSDTGKRISTGFGVAMLLLALLVDLRTRSSKDFAFWLYVLGVMTFWGGLTSMNSNSEVGKFIYFCINLGLIAVGTALVRRVFAVFGGIGVAVYLGHLSHVVFKDSMLFPVALTAIGLAVIGAGVAWQRHELRLGHWLRAMLPAAIRALVQRRVTIG